MNPHFPIHLLPSETGREETVTMSRPKRPPAMAAQAATIAPLWILIFRSMFMVTTALYTSVLTRSAVASARSMSG